jgi:hypothetical protein
LANWFYCSRCVDVSERQPVFSGGLIVKYSDIDFVIIGPGHSGSTWLRDQLFLVPDIYIPKETNLLTWTMKKDENWVNFYIGASARILGEHANSYFSHPQAPYLMHKSNPTAKFIVMVSNPVRQIERHYRHDCRWGQFPPMWRIDVACEHDAFFERYIGTASYVRNVQRWLEYFKPDNFFLFNADLEGQEREKCFMEVLRFIGAQEVIPQKFYEPSNKSVFTMFPHLHRKATFDRRRWVRSLCAMIDPLNRALGAFKPEPRFSDTDKDIVKSALGQEATLDPFLRLARSRGIKGVHWFEETVQKHASP